MGYRLIFLVILFYSEAFASYEIPNAGVTTAKIATGAVTQVKKAIKSTGSSVSAGNVAFNSSISDFSTSASSYTDVTNVTSTVVTLGGPVQLFLWSDGGGNNFSRLYYQATGSGLQTISGCLTIIRDSSTTLTQLCTEIRGYAHASGDYIGGAIALPMAIDSGAAAGSHTYKLQAFVGSGVGTIELNSLHLVAYEL